MKFRIYRVRICLVSLAFILSACGGGGGNNSSSVNDTTISSAPSSSSNSSSSSSIAESSISSNENNLPESSISSLTSNANSSLISSTSSNAVNNASSISNSSSSLLSSSSSSKTVTTLLSPDLVTPSALNLVQDQLLTLRLDNLGGKEIIECSSDLPASFSVTVASDATTCEISGEASTPLALTSFTITAINATGSDSVSLPLEILAATPFVTTWKTDNPGMSESNQITIQTSPNFSYDFRVDWGDGLIDENVTGDITHTYATPDVYEVSITGTFPQPFFKNQNDSQKLLSVDHWGNRKWLAMNRAFFNCRNLTINDLQAPDLSRVTDMSDMFLNADNLGGNISNWDVSTVTSMANMFNGADKFNLDISSWDVSNVTAMNAMFAFSGFNGNISAWNVSKVTNMSSMFNGAGLFNQNLGNWNVENVKDMRDMFLSGSFSSDNYDAILIGWSQLPSLVHSVSFNADTTNFSINAQAAHDLLVNNFGWDITDGGIIRQPELQDSSLVFYTNLPENYTIKNVGGNPVSCTSDNLPAGLDIQVSADGASCEVFGAATTAQAAAPATIIASNASGNQAASLTFTVKNQTPFITRWKTDNPGISADNQITINKAPGFSYSYRVDWGDGLVDENVTGDIIHSYAVPGVYDVAITGTFPQPFFPRTTNVTLSDSQKLLSVEQWGNRYWLSMAGAFYNCDNLVIDDIESPDFSHLTNMSDMFNNASNFNSDISRWDVSSVTNMSSMFADAAQFNSDISNWDVSNLIHMNGMFMRAAAFNQPLGTWNVSSVREMPNTFRGATVFNQDISAWNVSEVTNMNAMFREARAFNQSIGNWNVSHVVNLGETFFAANQFNADLSSWDVSKVTNMSRMFRGTQSFNQNLGSWNVANVTDMNDLLFAGVLSTANYDAMLIGWSHLPSLKNGVVLSVGTTQFSTEAQDARDHLVSDFGWTILDGGLAP